ncbi:hypothetical protein IID23_02285 [Patescibacteria group bacterium]|nr:hypothetical protein [Patescibacteria group bacterium]
MPVKNEKRTIKDSDGKDHEYFCIQMTPSAGEPIKFKLLAMLGPALSSLASAPKNSLDNLSGEKAVEIFGNAITKLFENNDPTEVFKFLQNLIMDITRDEVRINQSNFDDIYGDNIGEFYKALAFVLEVNFGNFLKGSKLLSTILSKAST